jgi:hypothetical protein
VGTSNVKDVNEKFLSLAVIIIKSIAYTIEDATSFLDSEPVTKYDAILLHILTNNLKTDDPVECAGKLKNLIAESRKKWPVTKLIISLCTPRNDGLHTKGQLVNATIKQQLLPENDENLSFIEHHNMFNINNGGQNLYLLKEVGYHLNDTGASKLAVNFRSAIHFTLSSSRYLPFGTREVIRAIEIIAPGSFMALNEDLSGNNC